MVTTTSTTIKERNITYSGLVIDIQNDYKQKGGKHIHLITFKMEDGSKFIAEEAEDDLKSRFTMNRKNFFEVTHPGKPGGLDWIRFKHIEGALPPPSREDISMAIAAMNCATQLGIKNDWTVDQIVNNAYILAGNIKLVARELAEEML